MPKNERIKKGWVIETKSETEQIHGSFVNIKGNTLLLGTCSEGHCLSDIIPDWTCKQGRSDRGKASQGFSCLVGFVPL